MDGRLVSSTAFFSVSGWDGRLGMICGVLRVHISFNAFLFAQVPVKD
jgi:hypothetical protein